MHVVVQVIGSPVSGSIGATFSVTVNIILVEPVLVNVNVGFCAVELLMVELPVPPDGGETVQLYCKSSGTPLQLGGLDALFAETFNTEQPDVEVRVNSQAGGGITQTVPVNVSSPQPFAIC